MQFREKNLSDIPRLVLVISLLCGHLNLINLCIPSLPTVITLGTQVDLERNLLETHPLLLLTSCYVVT